MDLYEGCTHRKDVWEGGRGGGEAERCGKLLGMKSCIIMIVVYRNCFCSPNFLFTRTIIVLLFLP